VSAFDLLQTFRQVGTTSAVEEAVSPYELIKRGFGSAVPFAAHSFIEVLEVGAGLGIARLQEGPEVHNHIRSVHAGAIFTLGETASAAAMLGVFAEQITLIRPVTTEVTISYLKIAKGSLMATARSSLPAERLQHDLATQGRATLVLTVDIANGRGGIVAQMQAKWTVSASKSGSGWMSAFDP
jgi:acyl-coenzyme A thioesterase PaaI-like protein